MSSAHVFQAMERCLVGTPLREAVSEWLGAMVQHERWLPIVLHRICEQEHEPLVAQLHDAAQRLQGSQECMCSLTSKDFLNDWQTYGERVFQDYSGTTLFLEDFTTLSKVDRLTLLQMMGESSLLAEGELLLVLTWPEQPNLEEAEWLQQHNGYLLTLQPLFQRGADIDRLVCRLAQQIIQKHGYTNLQGFSLEAIAHIHRAVLQTTRDSQELYMFLEAALERGSQGQLPLDEEYIVAWPTVRLLEDLWQYRSLESPSTYEELLQYDFQERLFSASLEQAACRSGLSQELIGLECQLLQTMIEELPEHQRNYQGITARLDQLLWMGMKLISNARTQAELRDYFGFGSKGKIPKATAKLKFDQYDLDHYGFRASDPQPWNNEALEFHTPVSAPTTPAAVPEPPSEQAQSSQRDILEIDGELPETLFWRHQDLFTVLGADSLTAEQISSLMNTDLKTVNQDLHQLVNLGMLDCKEGRFLLPSDDLYYAHTHSPLRFLEDNLLRSLHNTMKTPNDSLLDNLFLRLPAEGLPMLRETLIQPFIHQQLLPIADQPTESVESYGKKMYSLLLVGTHRLSPQVHGRLPMEERVQYYFREASLQRADQQQRHQAICLQASLMMSSLQAPQALSLVQELRKELRQHLPQGRGNKPNFNITLCFTEVPLQFYRDLTTDPLS